MDDHPFFEKFAIEELTLEDFDERLAADTPRVNAVFFWGHNCPNCEVAKNTLVNFVPELEALGFNWFHVNVYKYSELGTRFGLHGIPTFIFFKQGRKLGKISPFPGDEPFFEALKKLK